MPNTQFHQKSDSDGVSEMSGDEVPLSSEAWHSGVVLHTSMHNAKRVSHVQGPFRTAMRLAMDTVLRGHATSKMKCSRVGVEVVLLSPSDVSQSSSAWWIHQPGEVNARECAEVVATLSRRKRRRQRPIDPEPGSPGPSTGDVGGSGRRGIGTWHRGDAASVERSCASSMTERGSSGPFE